MSNPFLRVWLYPASLASFAVATCYNPDGSAISNPAFQACNQVVGATSMCCGTNWTNGIVAKDACEPNGLCLNSANGAPLYWRGSCTDKTWKSPNCLANLCTKPSDISDPTLQNVALTECADGSWCCQGDNTQCCNSGKGTFIAAVIGVSSTTSASSTSTSIASTTAGASAPSQTGTSSTPSTTPDSSGLSAGAKTGLGVGVSLGVLLIGLALGWWFWMQKKRSHGPRSAELAESQMRQELEAHKRYVEAPQGEGTYSFQHEVQGDSPPVAELSAYRTSRGL